VDRSFGFDPLWQAAVSARLPAVAVLACFVSNQAGNQSCSSPFGRYQFQSHQGLKVIVRLVSVKPLFTLRLPLLFSLKA
jgi:predicted component of type VI protein secretion system